MRGKTEHRATKDTVIMNLLQKILETKKPKVKRTLELLTAVGILFHFVRNKMQI
jgi:hypothetical protein